MPPSLTPRDERIVTLAQKGIKSPLDSSLYVLDELQKVEDNFASFKDDVDQDLTKLDTKIDDAVSQIQADAPDLNKVLESVRGADGAQGVQGEQGEAGESIVGPEGPAGKDGVDGKDGRDGIDGVDGINGVDGKDADETAILTQIENDLPKLGERIRDGLELLQGEERLDKSAIKGLDELLTDIDTRIKSIPRGMGARSSNSTKFFQLTADGATKVFTVPKSVASIVLCSDFPTVLMEGAGFTLNASRTQLTLTIANAPSNGAQLLYQYSSMFN